MSTHGVAEAKNKLSELINCALKGESVVITRHGHPVVELRAIQPSSRPVMTKADLEWLRERRERLPMSKVDGGTFVSQMRDEEWTR